MRVDFYIFRSRSNTNGYSFIFSSSAILVGTCMILFTFHFKINNFFIQYLRKNHQCFKIIVGVSLTNFLFILYSNWNQWLISDTCFRPAWLVGGNFITFTFYTVFDVTFLDSRFIPKCVLIVAFINFLLFQL